MIECGADAGGIVAIINEPARETDQLGIASDCIKARRCVFFVSSLRHERGQIIAWASGPKAEQLVEEIPIPAKDAANLV